tara:strand:- start:712 stop:852 length:141 start_codon:yes stop_codon:yes gene_type:complete
MGFIGNYMAYTTIQITPGTRDKLKDLGKKGESYEDVLLRLIKAYKK